MPAQKRGLTSCYLNKRRKMNAVPGQSEINSVEPNDFPRDFGPLIAFGAKVHLLVATQKGGVNVSP